MGTHFNGTAKQRRALDAFIKLMRCADAVTGRLAGSFRAGGLTQSQFGILEALLHLGPMHQKELGRKLLKSSGNITVVVDHLEQRGLVRRRQDRNDRRFTTISLTAAGRRLIDQAFPIHVELIIEEFSRLSILEQEQLAAICRKLGVIDSG